MTDITQKVFFYFDDSGVFHIKEQSGYFVYAGYVFTSREELETAKRKYIHANKQIKAAIGIDGELKAARLLPKHKRSLLNSVKNYNSISCAVHLKSVAPAIMGSKKAICRYKDFLIKKCIKTKIQELISGNLISAEKDIELEINIDQQLTGTDGYYDLRDLIREELQYGYKGFNYDDIHEPVINADVRVKIKYCDSKDNYLIQASDILANRIWTSFRINKPEWLNLVPNHTHINFP